MSRAVHKLRGKARKLEQTALWQVQYCSLNEVAPIERSRSRPTNPQSPGDWLLIATLADGSQHEAWTELR